MVSRQPCSEWVQSLDLFVSSAGTGQVINSSPQSLLVPKIPLCSPFYISRTFHICSSSIFRLQSCHLSVETGFGNSICFFAALTFPASGVTLPKQGNFSPADIQGLYPGLMLGQDPEEAARGSTDKGRGRRTEDFSSQSSLPSEHNSFISQKWRNLKFYILSLVELPEN